MSADFIARGLTRLNAAQLASNAEGEGSARVGFRASATSTTTRTVQDKLREIVSVKDYGAKGNGTTDDTSAIQSAINAVFSHAGGALYFPNGTYRISSKLVIPVSSGWRIFGESRHGARIKQYTANTQILSLEGDNTHSWAIENLYFEWSTAQPSANTQAVAIFMGTGAATSAGFYEWSVRDCTFNNGFRAIAADSSNSPPLWGALIQNCFFEGSMSGASFFAVPTPAVGQPNICIENCLIRATAASEAMIRILAGDNVLLRNIEFNGGTAASPLIQITTSGPVTLIGCKVESYNAGSAAGAKHLFLFSQCRVVAIGCSCNGITGSAGSVRLLQGTSGTELSVIGVECSSAMSGGVLVPYAADDIKFVSGVKLTATGAGACSEDLRTYLGAVPLPRFHADRRQGDAVTDIGDASVTLTASSDAVQYQNVTLTANRTVTLPSTGLYEGMSFHIVRRAATPGAFTLQVVDPIGAVNYTLASATNGYVKYRAKGGAWRIIEAGTV
jgi:hypothetical protein